MKKLTKALAVILAIAMMIPSVVFAAESPAKKDIFGATISLKYSSYTYNGNYRIPVVTKVTVGNKTLEVGTDCAVYYAKHKNAGTYSVLVVGTGDYTGVAEKNWTIKKANQTLKVSPTSKTYRRTTDLKRSSKSFTIKVTGNKTGKATFKSSNTKYVKVSSTGKVTVAKGAKAGKYYVTVSAKSSTNYNSASKKVYITVK